MSTLRTNALEGVDAKNSITIVAGAGNITTTNVQEGICKSWVNFDGTASGAASRDSFNVSSMTDGGTGNYTVSINNDMNDANYCCMLHASQDSGNRASLNNRTAQTASSIQLACNNHDNSTSDLAKCHVSVHGDLA